MTIAATKTIGKLTFNVVRESKFGFVCEARCGTNQPTARRTIPKGKADNFAKTAEQALEQFVVWCGY